MDCYDIDIKYDFHGNPVGVEKCAEGEWVMREDAEKEIGRILRLLRRHCHADRCSLNNGFKFCDCGMDGIIEKEISALRGGSAPPTGG